MLSYVLANCLVGTYPPTVTTVARVVCYIELGFIAALWVIGIVLDPETTIRTVRRVGASIEGYEDGSGFGGVRVVEVKRPLVGFKKLEYQVRTPEAFGYIWVDGVRHEKAFIRI